MLGNGRSEFSNFFFLKKRRRIKFIRMPQVLSEAAVLAPVETLTQLVVYLNLIVTPVNHWHVLVEQQRIV